MPFQHPPSLKRLSVALAAALDPNRNDVLEQAGDGVHNLAVADVLYDYFFTAQASAPFEPDDSEEPEIATRVEYTDDDKRYAAFEHSLTLLSSNVVMGRIQCRMDEIPIPKTYPELKRQADILEAHSCYIKKTYSRKRLLDFYRSFILPAMPSIHASFELDWPTKGTLQYLGDMNSYRLEAYSQVDRKHEDRLVDLLYTDVGQPVRGYLTELSALTLTPAVEFDNKGRVVGPCRPLELLGYIAWKEAVAFQCAHWNVCTVGTTLFLVMICKLAASKGVGIFLAAQAGLEVSHSAEFSDDLPALFYVAVGKLRPLDEAKLKNMLESTALYIIDLVDKVLHEFGKRCPSGPS
ncbi:hypothetical protein ONZ45_g4233 [Pleurotus djamor]|nr:hypothetical protein ONZ45_g4233 [Pleurotus djamor]